MHVFKLLSSRLATYFIIVNNEISDLFSKFNFGKAVKWYNMSGLTTFFLFMLILKIATLSWLSKNQIRMRVPLLVMFKTTSSPVRAWSKMNMNHEIWWPVISYQVTFLENFHSKLTAFSQIIWQFVKIIFFKTLILFLTLFDSSSSYEIPLAARASPIISPHLDHYYKLKTFGSELGTFHCKLEKFHSPYLLWNDGLPWTVPSNPLKKHFSNAMNQNHRITQSIISKIVS